MRSASHGLREAEGRKPFRFFNAAKTERLAPYRYNSERHFENALRADFPRSLLKLAVLPDFFLDSYISRRYT
jgi:hypothetical protein